MNPLRTLDDALVPRLAQVLRRAIDAARRAPGPVAGPVRRLDRRFASGGVLGFVRDLPQVGFLVVGALLVAAALGAVRVDADRSSGPPSAGAPTARATAIPGCGSGTADPEGGAYVGPAPAADLPTYVQAQDRLLAACAGAAPHRRALAVVSLPQAVTPGGAAAALPGVTVEAVSLSIAGHPGTPYELPLTGASGGTAAASISAAYAAAQAQFEQDRTLELAQADSVQVTDPAEAEGKQAFVAQAADDELAVGQLRDQCACVYGAVVSGTIRAVSALRTSSVRVVALAPAGTVAGRLTSRPLLPAETTTLSDVAAPVVPEAGQL